MYYNARLLLHYCQGLLPFLFSIYRFEKVWLLIFIAIFTVAFVMTLFSRILSLFASIDRELPISTLRYATDYVMYIIKIITNQGNII